MNLGGNNTMAKGFGDMMKQAQKLQKQMLEIQEEIGLKTVEGSSGGEMVKIIMNGRQEILDVKIDPEVVEQIDQLEEYESLDNITVKNFLGLDRYVILRDGEELLLAFKGKNDSNHLAFHTRDAAHIRIFSSLVMEAWLRSRPFSS